MPNLNQVEQLKDEEPKYEIGKDLLQELIRCIAPIVQDHFLKEEQLAKEKQVNHG